MQAMKSILVLLMLLGHLWPVAACEPVTMAQHHCTMPCCAEGGACDCAVEDGKAPSPPPLTLSVDSRVAVAGWTQIIPLLIAADWRTTSRPERLLVRGDICISRVPLEVLYCSFLT